MYILYKYFFFVWIFNGLTYQSFEMFETLSDCDRPHDEMNSNCLRYLKGSGCIVWVPVAWDFIVRQLKLYSFIAKIILWLGNWNFISLLL